MNYKRLIISLIVPQLAGALGSFFTMPAIEGWYATLEKPAFSPPNWIFGPAWFLLYLLMGVSLYLVWHRRGKKTARRFAIRLFWVHLFFNATWSLAFFGLQNPALAFANIIILWLLIIAVMVKFWPIRRWSTYLLIPYFAWVTFASVLNYFMWVLN